MDFHDYSTTRAEAEIARWFQVETCDFTNGGVFVQLRRARRK
jgi:hypothetical protein